MAKYFKLSILVIVTCVVVIGLLGYQVYALSRENFSLSEKLTVLSEENTEQLQDLRLCFEDRGILVEEEVIPYRVGLFLPNSKLFEGKDVTKKTVRYNGQGYVFYSILVEDPQKKIGQVIVEIFEVSPNDPNRKQVYFDTSNLGFEAREMRRIYDDFTSYQIGSTVVKIQNTKNGWTLYPGGYSIKMVTNRSVVVVLKVKDLEENPSWISEEHHNLIQKSFLLILSSFSPVAY